MSVPVPHLLPAFGASPAVELRTALIGLHLLGLCFGLGGATMLYFWILRWMRRGHLPGAVLRIFAYLGKVVTAGLTLLWLSGLGFLLLYWATDPGKLENGKIWAKLVIVTALTLNGLLLHSRVMPLVRRSASAPLLSRESRKARLLFVWSGAISGTSWYAAFALGILRELNGTVSCAVLLGAWVGLVGLAGAVMTLMIAVKRGRPMEGTEGAIVLADATQGAS